LILRESLDMNEKLCFNKRQMKVFNTVVFSM